MSRVALSKVGSAAQLFVHGGRSMLSPAVTVTHRNARYQPKKPINYNDYKYRSPLMKKIFKKQDSSLNWAKPLINYMQEKQMQQEGEKKEPYPLHVVWRVQSLRGRPWWEKDIITEFGLEDKQYKPVVVKNSPLANKKLAEVKHLVRILPLTFPDGLPEHESDYQHSFIDINGQFRVQKRLTDSESPAPEEEPQRSKWTLTPESVKKRVMRKKELYQLNAEYHEPYYSYKFNQDGKERRYNKYKDTPKYKT